MKKAFTLIELLVVIAIIAILAAILFPVFAQAKLAAKKTVAVSNVKQLDLAMQMYTADYDDVYYEHAQGLSTGTELPTSLIWNGWLFPYTKSVALAIDPVAQNPVSSYNNINYTGKYWVPVDYKQLSLAYNIDFTTQFDYACSQDFSPGTPNCSVFWSANQFEFPVQQVVFVSSVYTAPSALGAGFWAGPDHNLEVPNGPSAPFSGFSVVSFADGHAKAIMGRSMLVADQVLELNPATDDQCVNYDSAKVYWDPSAPVPDNQATCEGFGIR